MRRPKETSVYICAVCGERVSLDTVVRSNRWYKGVVGVRMNLCSPECRDKYDEGDDKSS